MDIDVRYNGTDRELETFEEYVEVCYLDVPDVRQLAQEDPPVINGIRVKDDYTIQENDLLIESKQFLDNPVVLSRDIVPMLKFAQRSGETIYYQSQILHRKGKTA